MKLSASSIGNFKACPVRFKYHDLYRVRKIEDTESQRRGNIWHKLHELISQSQNEKTIIDYINEQYADVPESRTYEDWIIERIVLLNSFAGYLWYYQQQSAKYTVLVAEYEFETELFGHVFHGKIDQIVRDEYGQVYVREFKSTSKTLADETYWSHLTLDIQTSLYLLVTQQLQMNGELIQFGISPDEPLVSKVLYNVWHKPQIAPTWLTQKDSKVLIESGEYCGQKFNVVYQEADKEMDCVFEINGVAPTTKPGAKTGTFAVYETPELFGARLLQDITTRPEFYYQEREIAKTEQDMLKFFKELSYVCRDIEFKTKEETWYSCERECNSRFRCEYFSVCNNNMELSPDNIPVGYEEVEEK